jgi:acyl-CoA synthetase (AMP-forming)/AMP-acid ligase II
MGLNHAAAFRAVARAVPERDCVVAGGRRLSFAEIEDRSLRLANLLMDHGIGLHTEREALAGWESGQDHVALYLHNGPEYLEGMFGASLARAASFNVNYRYVDAELRYLLNDAAAAAVVFHAAFAPTLARALDGVDRPPLLLQVADGSGNALLPGALDYEQVLAAAANDPPDLELKEDDLYVLYTGGTTGYPKGTLWRQGDLFDTTLGPLVGAGGADPSSLGRLEETVRASGERRGLPAPPLMHGAGQWVALGLLLGGGTVVFPDVVANLDPGSILDAIERERVQLLAMVGEAFARPLCDELEHRPRDVSSLQLIVTGGAATSPGTKTRLLELVIDSGGASETGPQLNNLSAPGGEPTSGLFSPSPSTLVLDEERQRVLPPGHAGVGWLAHDGPIPLGYLGDKAKTAATFPVVEGRRMVIPGDRARLRADGLVELVGRESMTINSGGEKIFAEEVEQALMTHPDVHDVLVVGRPHERFGHEVVAVVQLGPGSTASDESLRDAVLARLARYKAPRAFVRVEAVRRTPTGKPDYPWAREVATAG